MTVLDDIWPILDKMIDVREVGVYNITNPGVTEHNWILGQYKKYIEPNHTWKLVTYKEQLQFIKADRSNNEMDTTKLENFCKTHDLELLPIQDSILRCFERRVQSQSK
jgi:UDP-glucose 4,6-dehydratase